MRFRFKVLLVILATGFPYFSSTAQEPVQAVSVEKEYHRGLELYEKQKYGAARQCFENLLADEKLHHTLLEADARYFVAMCAIQLYHKDAEYLVNNFVAYHPESPRVNGLRFEMGRYFYGLKRFRDAAQWLSEVDKKRLSRDDLSEYYFKLGYAYFMTNDLDKARFAFSEIKDVDTKYTPPAVYYYSHIAYTQQNYETALEGFRRLENDETFAPVVPYYIIQILYLQKKYDELISYAPDKMKTISEKRLPETARLVGDAFFRKNMFSEAIPYLEIYKEKNQYMSNEDKYVLGFAYYKSGRFEDASKMLEQITAGESELKQNAMYVLGDCYVRTARKDEARMAFSAAARMNFDGKIAEDALFNYAKLTYELSYSPFNEAIRAFNDYLTKYPGSDRADEAYNYLLQVYMSTRNYKDALASIQKIRVKDDRVKKAWQRVAFFRALELYSNLDFQGAISLLDVSLQYGNYDKNLKALAFYWKGEAWYRLGDYTEAIDQYQNFLAQPAAPSTDVYSTALYNTGYACFNLKRYADAALWFGKFLDREGGKATDLVADAYNRLGDCYFIQPDYQKAIVMYNKAIALNKYDADYALFQKGFSLGLLEKTRDKITVLNQLLTSYPRSRYVPDALFELGNSYMKLQEPQKALDFYQRILASYPSSSYYSKAMVQAGLVYRNLDRDNEALEMYKKVVAEFPGTTEARSALNGIQNIYVEQGKADDYVNYLKTIGTMGELSAASQDSLMYRSAENIYLTGDCSRSQVSFQRYLDRFPEGIFALNAHFYLSDCALRSGSEQDALPHLLYIAGKPRNMFTEEALLSAARIEYKMQNYMDAVAHYKTLESLAEVRNNQMEARIGLMRCYDKLNEFKDAYDAADRVLSTEKIPPDVIREARFILAKSAAALDRTDVALENYRKVATEVKSIQGAEAKFRVAEIYWQRKQYDKAEKEIFDYIDMNTPHQYWMARAFILLADIYTLRKDYFQAQQTLQSLIDYYENPNDGIIDMARQRKAAIDQATQKGTAREQDTLEIKIPNRK